MEKQAAAPQAVTSSYGVRGWVLGLCNCGRPHQPGRRRCRCVDVRDTPIDKPDLAIYSQAEEIAAGNLPSWDSPDILTNTWQPFRLMEEARVTVRNLSPTTPAINALVHYFTSPFGIGTRRQLRLTQRVSIAASAQVELRFPLQQEILTGDPRVGVHIQIEHPADSHSINNSGSQIHDGAYTTESGRTFEVQVPVLNDAAFSRQITLSILPSDLLATVTPASRTFLPYEQVVARLQVQVPGFLTGTPTSVLSRSVTVVGRAGGELIGGVTRLVRIDN